MRILTISAFSLFATLSPLKAQPQIGGGSCTTSMMSGIYYYLISGELLSAGQAYPYAELGKLVADGAGGVSGNSHASIGGSISQYTFSGGYSVQPNCAGTMTITVNSQASGSFTFQVTNGGQGAVIAFSSSSVVAAGRVYRQTANPVPLQCTTASLSGGYSYLLTGAAFLSGIGYYYSEVGSATGDGRGDLLATGMANVNGTTAAASGQGFYSLASDCSGTASVKSQNGTANYYIAVVLDGQAVLFLESDSGYTVAGVADPLFVAPQAAVVSAASFSSAALAPGGIFSIFGQGLPGSAASARASVNGENAPVFFANGNQINAQMPYDAPTNASVLIDVNSGNSSSNTVQVGVKQAAPAIFTSSNGRAIVQNSDYTINSPSNPAHVGDTAIVYLTGAGAVSPSVSTGTAPPPTPLSTVLPPYSFTVGGVQAAVSYLGLTPGFAGLYQANITIPSLTPGDYPIIATVAGTASNGPLMSVH